jgi:cell shape-determining protein MreD
MRRAILVAIPVLVLTVILQISIASRIMLLGGNMDLVLLVVVAWGLQEKARGAWIWGIMAGLLVGLVSGIPWFIYLIGYLSVVLLTRLLVHRIWQAPLLVMFAVTLIGTLELLMMMFLFRTLFQVQLPLGEALVQIFLPTILLNLLLAIPIHTLIRDLANLLYKEKEAL